MVFSYVWERVCRFVLFLTGWKFKIHPSYIERDRQVIVYPHTSSWELFLGVLIKGAYHIENTKIIAWNGLFHGIRGVFLRLCGCIPIENMKPTGSVMKLSNILNNEGKFKFCISPEGTRSLVQKFRTGFHYITKNTHSVLNIVDIDYKYHQVVYGRLFTISDDIQKNCDALAKIFGKMNPLYPEHAFYCKNKEVSTSMIDWRSFSNIFGLFSAFLLGYYSFWVSSILVFLKSIAAIDYKNPEYHPLEDITTLLFFESYFLYNYREISMFMSFLMLLFYCYLFVNRNRFTPTPPYIYTKYCVINNMLILPLTLLKIF